MFGFRDVLLLFVIYSSMGIGIVFSEAAAVFRPYPLYCMMMMLFLSFIPMKAAEIRQTFVSGKLEVAWLVFLKLVALPALVYLVTLAVWPRYALGSLLLTGISTGVVAPFVSGLVGGYGPLVVIMVVVTSVAAPFTLPVLVKTLAGQHAELALWPMIALLAQVIFMPFAAVEILRKWTPSVIRRIHEFRFPVSLFLFSAVNLGVFSRYGDFFRNSPAVVLEASVVAVLIGAACCLCGIYCLPGKPVYVKTAAAVSFANMNNVLIMVFAAEFFGPIESAVAAMYMIPFFGLVVPLRLYAGSAEQGRGGARTM